MIAFLDDSLIDIIFSFYNPYKKLYLLVLYQLKNKNIYSKCILELKRFCVYDKNNKILSFQRQWIIG